MSNWRQTFKERCKTFVLRFATFLVIINDDSSFENTLWRKVTVKKGQRSLVIIKELNQRFPIFTNFNTCSGQKTIGNKTRILLWGYLLKWIVKIQRYVVYLQYEVSWYQNSNSDLQKGPYLYYRWSCILYEIIILI